MLGFGHQGYGGVPTPPYPRSARCSGGGASPEAEGVGHVISVGEGAVLRASGVLRLSGVLSCAASEAARRPLITEPQHTQGGAEGAGTEGVRLEAESEDESERGLLGGEDNHSVDMDEERGACMCGHMCVCVCVYACMGGLFQSKCGHGRGRCAWGYLCAHVWMICSVSTQACRLHLSFCMHAAHTHTLRPVHHGRHYG